MSTLMATAAQARRPRFRDLSRAEWTKLRSVRSTVWSLLVMAVLTLGFTVLITSMTVNDWSSARSRSDFLNDPTGTIFGGLGWSELIVCVLGALVITSEFGTGMIRASVLAVPRRTPMLAAKAAVFGAVILVVGEVLAFVDFFVGAAIMGSHVDVSLTAPGVLRAVIGVGLFLTVMSLIALATGAIIRHTAGAIATVVAFVIVISTLPAGIPGSLGHDIQAVLPTDAGQLIISTHQQTDQVLSPWQGFGVMCLWAIGLLTLAAYLLRRRDV